jgi:hypothetical protein
VRTVAHIDGDILVYAGGFAAEKGQYTMVWTDEDGTEHKEHFPYKKEAYARSLQLSRPFVMEFERFPEPIANALNNVKNTINSIKETLGVDDYVVHLSGPTNFRNELATVRTYKGNRSKTHKPVHGPAIREYLSTHHPHVISDNEEADDVIGYMHYARYKEDMESSIICTQDKDLNMIPGHHYNFYKKERYFVTDEQADWNFYKQLLTGDTTDNIVGVPKIGHAKAEKLLRGLEGDVEGMYNVVQLEYTKAYPENADAMLLENARLLWIRREKGELWQPPTDILTNGSTSFDNSL